jgi:hypothetical protein
VAAGDLGHVEQIVVDVGREVMGEAAITRSATRASIFTVILRAKEFVDQYLIEHEFVKRLHTRFNAEAVVIPFPIRTIACRESAADAGAPRIDGAA